MYRLFLKKMEIDTKLKETFPLIDDGLVPVTCAGVECTFEFIGYSYQGGQEEPTLRRRPSRQPPQPSRSSEIRSLSHSPLSASKSKNNRPLIPSLSTASLHGPSRSNIDLVQFSPPTPDVKDNRERFLLPKKTNNVRATSNPLAQSTEHFGYISDPQYLLPLNASQPTTLLTSTPPGTPV